MTRFEDLLIEIDADVAKLMKVTADDDLWRLLKEFRYKLHEALQRFMDVSLDDGRSIESEVWLKRLQDASNELRMSIRDSKDIAQVRRLVGTIENHLFPIMAKSLGGAPSQAWSYRDRGPLFSPRPKTKEIVPEPVLLGATAPMAVRPGEEFTARFVAYIKALEPEVKEKLATLSARECTHLGLKECRWRPGTHVTVTLLAKHCHIDEGRQEFEWTGAFNLVDFDVNVPADAPEETVVMKFDVYIDEIRIAKLRIDLKITRTARKGNIQTSAIEPAKTAFASYAKVDCQRVIDRVAAVRTSAGLEVFVDCLSLHPGDEWKPRLEREICERDLFLLFWSRHAMRSQWVEWEWRTALAKKGLGAFQFQLLDMFKDAPPPEELSHLQFNDPLMSIRRAYEDKGPH